MAATIKIKNSSTAGSAPSAGSLVQGELAVNVTDKKIYTKDSGGSVVELGINPTTVNGLTVGKGAGSVSTNTAVGASALAGNTTGGWNTVVGQNALAANTTANNNSAFGQSSQNKTTTASDNSSFGANSLGNNTTGANNTAIGSAALISNTTASYNTAVGYQAAYSNTTGTRHSAFGLKALYTNTTGTNNNAFGIDALGLNTTGSYNTAFGDTALGSNTTASNNTAVGYQAGYSTATGNGSIYIGQGAGYSSTATGNVFNTLVGTTAGYSLTSGKNNTFIGAGSTTGGAGYYVTTGSQNVILGQYNGNQGGLDIRTANNYIVLSDGDGNPRIQVDGSGNTTVKGASNITFKVSGAGAYSSYVYLDKGGGGGGVVKANGYLYCYAGDQETNGVYLAGSGATSWSSTSDERLKTDLVPIQNATGKVSSLRAVTGRFKTDAEGVSRSFLIAQDMQAVFPEAVSVVTSPNAEDNDEFLGIQYTEVIPLLVAAIKELKAEIDTLKGQA